MTRADIARQLDMAKNNVVVLGFDIPRAVVAVTKAEKVLLAAERRLDRLHDRFEKWQARVEQHAAELEDFDRM